MVDVTDAAHPTIAREIVLPRGFASVEVLGLIYLVDQDGLKILRKAFSVDPEVEREFEKHLCTTAEAMGEESCL